MVPRTIFSVCSLPCRIGKLTNLGARIFNFVLFTMTKIGNLYVLIKLMEDQQQEGSKQVNRMPYINSTNILNNDFFLFFSDRLTGKYESVLKKKNPISKYFWAYIKILDAVMDS